MSTAATNATSRCELWEIYAYPSTPRKGLALCTILKTVCRRGGTLVDFDYVEGMKKISDFSITVSLPSNTSHYVEDMANNIGLAAVPHDD